MKFSNHIEKSVIRAIGRKRSIKIDGVVKIVERVINPLCQNYVKLADALNIDINSIDWKNVPYLIRENIDYISAGVVEAVISACDVCGVKKSGHINVLPSDTDVHPNFRFSFVAEIDGLERFAYKARSPDCESFISLILDALELQSYFYVPEITPLTAVSYKQNFVSRSTVSTDHFPMKMAWSMGKFLAVCQLLGMNDLHEENIIFDGVRFAIVDGETLFQDSLSRSSAALKAGDSYLASSPLATHLLTYLNDHEGVDIIGCFSRLLLDIGVLQSPGSDISRQIVGQLMKGYQIGSGVADLIVAALPPELSIRKVFMPTAAYAGIVSRESVDCLYGTHEALSARINSSLTKLEDIYGGPLESASSELSRSFIPFYQTLISKSMMTSIVLQNCDKFAKHRLSNRRLLVNYVLAGGRKQPA